MTLSVNCLAYGLTKILWVSQGALRVANRRCFSVRLSMVVHCSSRFCQHIPAQSAVGGTNTVDCPYFILFSQGAHRSYTRMPPVLSLGSLAFLFLCAFRLLGRRSHNAVVYFNSGKRWVRSQCRMWRCSLSGVVVVVRKRA